MNAVLDPLRRITRELVARKLWPIAALLLVAVVAVPVAIGSSSAPAPDPLAPAAPAAGAAAGQRSLITAVDQPVSAKADRPGKLDDPFYDPPAPPKAVTAIAGAGSGATGQGSAAPAPPARLPSAAPKPSAPPAPAPTAAPAESPAAAPAPRSSYVRTELRWYRTRRGAARPVARLTPLGAGPAALFLGVRRTRRPYAVFLLGPHAISAGEGACEDRACRTVRMLPGQRRIVVVREPGGEARMYGLEVESIATVSAGDAHARRMRDKVHPDGREAMRAMWQDAATAEALGPFGYDATAGLLTLDRAAVTPAKAAG